MTVLVLPGGLCAGAVLCVMNCELGGLSPVDTFEHLEHACLTVLDTGLQWPCWKLSGAHGAALPQTLGTRERTV